MPFRRISQRHLLAACESIGPEDGVDPRLSRRAAPAKVANRKALQLCGQVQRTLALVLSGESGDDVLRDLLVESVVPFPTSGRLLVTVYSATVEPAVPDAEILGRLERARGRLRCEIAAVVHRRKIPDLVFRLRLA
jgi:ribosome-binding factor A